MHRRIIPLLDQHAFHDVLSRRACHGVHVEIHPLSPKTPKMILVVFSIISFSKYFQNLKMIQLY